MFAKDFITGLILMAVIFLMLITVLDQKQIKNKLKFKIMKKLLLVLGLGVVLSSCEKEPLEDVNTDTNNNGSTCIYNSDGGMECKYNIEVVEENE